ncbi:dtw domain-containing protein 2, partial [Phtheirospermum japonicum]
TKVIILHHPHERRHKLATVPILSKCLRDCEIIVGRKLKYGQSKLLDSLHDRACENPNSPLRCALYLFPGPNASPLVETSRAYSSHDNADMDDPVLVVFDGTWKHAKEMVLASLSFLSKFAIQVCLDFDAGANGGTIFDSELILRKEPFAGCMSTMEAVARCLRVLEPNGIDIESRIIEVLRAMVSFQASFLKPSKPSRGLSKLMKNNYPANEEID